MKTYQLGAKVRLEAKFTNASSVATDPDTVTLRVQKPDGTVTTYGPGSVGSLAGFLNPAVGTWQRDIDGDLAGSWQYRFNGTGAVVVEQERSFRIRPRRVPNS